MSGVWETNSNRTIFYSLPIENRFFHVQACLRQEKLLRLFFGKKLKRMQTSKDTDIDATLCIDRFYENQNRNLLCVTAFLWHFCCIFSFTNIANALLKPQESIVVKMWKSIIWLKQNISIKLVCKGLFSISSKVNLVIH